MTTDERIEALTQSVELLSQMHQDNEKKYTRMFERQDRMFERLTRIAEIHEDRIHRLEEHNGIGGE